MSSYDDHPVSEMLGKTIERVERDGNASLTFYCSDGSAYKLNHHDDCCESVYLEDVAGELSDLVGSPLLMSEEISSGDEPAKSQYDASHTWTYYKFATEEGYVTLRWYGTSNGYYSESVSCDRIQEPR